MAAAACKIVCPFSTVYLLLLDTLTQLFEVIVKVKCLASWVKFKIDKSFELEFLLQQGPSPLMDIPLQSRVRDMTEKRHNKWEDKAFRLEQRYDQKGSLE